MAGSSRPPAGQERRTPGGVILSCSYAPGGRNLGRWDVLEKTVLPALRRLSDRSGRSVSIVGASMGGVFAREAARREPDRVRCVVTLSSPVSGPHRANHIWPLFELASGQPAETASALPPPVPSTSIYTRSDGLLAWQTFLQPRAPLAENIEVQGSHLGLAWNPVALVVIADRLAQPPDRWSPFDTSVAASGAASLPSTTAIDPEQSSPIAITAGPRR